jgi:putative endopeptidase
MKMNFKHLLWVILPGVLIVSCNVESGKKATKAPAVKAVDAAYMDMSVRPGDDFNQYASGGWMKNNPVPDDKTQYGSFSVLFDKNQEQLQTLVQEAAEAQAETGSIAQKIGDFYNSGMDTTTINSLGYEPIKPELDAIDALKSNDQLLEHVGKMQLKGVRPLFYFFSSQDDQNSSMVIANFYQGGLGLPDRDYYTSDDAASTEMRASYLAHVQKMFELLDYSTEESKKMAEDIMKFETRLAAASLTRLENRDPYRTYNKMTTAELQEMAPEAKWNTLFEGLAINDPGEINVRQTDFIKEVAKMVKEESLDTWKTYLKWEIINSSANYLSADLEKADFEFYGTVMRGQKTQQPRWKRVLSSTSGSMGEAIGKLYVEKYFPAEAKERMINLVENLRVSLGDRIDQLDWMTEETKEKAHAKLGTMSVKVGYPDKWMDYSSLDIQPGKYYENIRAARAFGIQDDLSKIGKPYDKSEWGMTPQTVNAYYSPTANEIVFPAGILQPPFFFMDEDDAVNYGAIGVVIGHEMTHGFDDQGRNYDKDGNLQNWWAEEDAVAFEAKTKILVDQFNAFPQLDTLHVDGELTLGENIADLGGLSIAWDAFQKTAQSKTDEQIDGFTPQQRFFLSYAGVWRQNILDKELASRLKEDVHSPGEARVNGPLYNMEVFYQAFDVKEDAKLYIAPEDRAVIW